MTEELLAERGIRRSMNWTPSHPFIERTFWERLTERWVTRDPNDDTGVMSHGCMFDFGRCVGRRLRVRETGIFAGECETGVAYFSDSDSCENFWSLMKQSKFEEACDIPRTTYMHVDKERRERELSF